MRRTTTVRGLQSNDYRKGDSMWDEAARFDCEAEVTCPHCGERVTIGLDPGGGDSGHAAIAVRLTR